MRRPILIILTALAALLAAGGVAQAATPFTAGTAGAGSGGNPDVAVGADGVGHVAWMTGGANVQVGYCRVLPGASGCESTESLNFVGATAGGSGRASVFAPAPNKVVVVGACNQCPSGDITNNTFRWTSLDNGATFGPPVKIGRGFAAGGSGAWLEDYGIFVGVNAGSVKAMNDPPLGTPGGGVAYASGGVFSSTPQVVRLPGTDTLVAAVKDINVIRYGVYSAGGPLNIASVNTGSNWLPHDRTLPSAEANNGETALNSERNGIFLSYLSGSGDGAQVGLRRFDTATNTFGAPVYVQGSDPIDASSLDHPDSYQDASGRIHMVWRTLYDGGRLRYRVSDSTAANFGAVSTIARGETFSDPQVAAGPGGTGFAVWKGSGSAVRVVPLDPQAESAIPGMPGGPAGPGGPGTPGGPAGPAPTVSRTTVGDRTLRPGQGTTFTFISSKAGRAVLTIEKKFKGLKVKRRVKTKAGRRVVRRVCVVRTKKRLRAIRRKAKSARAYRKALRKQSCRGFRRVGKISQRVRPGRNTIRFNGRVAGRKLGQGVYRAKLVITDSAGQRSRAEVLRFKVVAPKKARGKRGTPRRR